MQKAQAGVLPLPRAIPGRVLAGLTGAVVLAHLVVLQNAPRMMDVPPRLSAQAFSTRTLQINAAPAQPEIPVLRAPPVPTRRNVAQAQPAATLPAVVAPPSAVLPVPIAQPEVARYDLAAPMAAQDPAPPSAAAASAPVPQTVAPAVAIAAAPEPVAAVPTAALSKDAALAARAYTVPGSTRLKYNATGRQSRMDYTAQGELLWLQDGATYNARLEVSAFLLGARVFSSAGQITADGLAPDRFADKFRSEQAAHFDRDKGRVTFSANTPEATLLPGAQDRLSVFVQLAAMVAGEPQKYPVGTTVTVQTVSRRAADTWVFTVEAEEKLRLPGGELDTLRLLCNPRKDFDQKVEVWLAPALAYLPARIRITEANGDFVDQQWRSTAAP